MIAHMVSEANEEMCRWSVWMQWQDRNRYLLWDEVPVTQLDRAREWEKWERRCSVLGWGRLLMGCASVTQAVCKTRNTHTHLIGPNKLRGLHNSFQPTHTCTDGNNRNSRVFSEATPSCVLESGEQTHFLSAAACVWSQSCGHTVGTSAEYQPC